MIFEKKLNPNSKIFFDSIKKQPDTSIPPAPSVSVALANTSLLDVFTKRESILSILFSCSTVVLFSHCKFYPSILWKDKISPIGDKCE